MSSDAIVILKDDHKQIKRLFRQFEKAGDDAHSESASYTEVRRSEALGLG